MSHSNLFVSRFAVSKSGQFAYNQKFHSGVNIIRGVNGTGKSTIIDLLSYALGAAVTEWTHEQLSCDWVLVEVALNGVPLCLKREISESGKARMDIFEGSFDDALKSVTGWTQYSYSRSDHRHSFSQQLFELLGLPRHKTDDSKNLTMHQIIRLLYVDQLTATTKLLKEDKEYDNVTIRRAIGEYLLGIDDLEAHNLRQELITANREFEKFNGELNAIYRLFGNTASQINEQALNNEIQEVSSRLEQLNKRKKDVLQLHLSQLDAIAKERANSLQNTIDRLSAEKQELEIKKAEIAVELTDTEFFFKTLEDRKLALEQSKLAFSSLGEVHFKFCPACLEPVVENEHSGCSLCKTERHDGKRDFAYIQMLNELNFQIRESQSLISNFRETIDSINSQLPSISRRLQEAKFEYQELEVTAEARDAVIAEIASEMGFCRSQILALEDRREHVNKVESLRLEKERLNAEILRLQDKLEQISARQANRYNEVYSSIEIKSAHILAQDGGYESTFDEVAEVNFDFAKDKMFVNGRSKFSASSMVVMKNSIRFAMFLHAVEDKDSRLPNFLLMDNIEDKGMVDERSHNFQKIIVSECEKLKSQYQLIFTTSMIDPELDGSPMCVGPMYEKGTHTLALK